MHRLYGRGCARFSRTTPGAVVFGRAIESIGAAVTDETTLKLARIMIIDDEDAVVRRLTEVLEAAEYENVVGTSDPVEAVAQFVKLEPDLLILDLEMPKLDGFGVIERIRPFTEEGAERPILALAAKDASAALRRRCISAGARDVVLKPIDDTELLARVRNLLEIRLLNLLMAGDGERIAVMADDVARQRTRALESVQRELLTRLAMAGEFKGTINIEHPEGVSLMASILARAMALGDDQADLIGRAAPPSRRAPLRSFGWRWGAREPSTSAGTSRAPSG